MAAENLFSPAAIQRSKDEHSTPLATTTVAGVIPAGGVGAAAGGWDTAGNRDTAITTITEIKTDLIAVRDALIAQGILA